MHQLTLQEVQKAIAQAQPSQLMLLKQSAKNWIYEEQNGVLKFELGVRDALDRLLIA
jgi:hypothetical protein